MMKNSLFVIIGMILLPFVYDSIHAESLEFTLGEVQWIKESHPPSGFSSIQVIDPDMNLSSNDIDKFKIRIWSDSDSDGITPYVYETSKDSGVFTSNISFSSNHSVGQRLHTLEEDLVIASYEDNTIPSSYGSKKMEILDSMIIRKTLANHDESRDFFRVDDPSFQRQNLQTGETISFSGTFVSMLVGSLGPILIVLFIVVYAVKKRRKKILKRGKNDHS